MQNPATAHDRRETALPVSEQRGSGTACCASNAEPPATSDILPHPHAAILISRAALTDAPPLPSRTVMLAVCPVGAPRLQVMK